MVNVVALFIVISCAATLNTHGIKVDSAKEAALALAPLAGHLGLHPLCHRPVECLALFGLHSAPVHGVFHLRGLRHRGGHRQDLGEAPAFYWLYTILIIIGAGVIMIPNVPLIQVMFWSQVINGGHVALCPHLYALVGQQ